jgi:hypothetical protein
MLNAQNITAGNRESFFFIMNLTFARLAQTASPLQLFGGHPQTQRRPDKKPFCCNMLHKKHNTHFTHASVQQGLQTLHEICIPLPHKKTFILNPISICSMRKTAKSNFNPQGLTANISKRSKINSALYLIPRKVIKSAQ